MDPESVRVVEQELAAWVASQSTQRRAQRTGGAASAILAAADVATRNAILANATHHKQRLAHMFDVEIQKGPAARGASPLPKNRVPELARDSSPAAARVGTQIDFLRLSRAALGECVERPLGPPRTQRVPPQRPREQELSLHFDDLIRLDLEFLAEVAQAVDSRVLVLALAGATHQLTDRIVSALPRRVARDLRVQMRNLGPTRLSDVEEAQKSLAKAAAKRLSLASRTGA
jgi:flagellar motor switch protein FliG